MTSSFTDLGNIGTGKSNGIDKNNINEARRQFQSGAIKASTPASREPGYDLGRQMMTNLQVQAANWAEINSPSHEEELHHEAA